MKVNKEKLKDKINMKISSLIDGAEKIGSLNHFEINIKHTEGQVVIELKNKYKDKI